jgi:transmembrane sensor
VIEFDWALFLRYHANECTAKERRRFERSLEADPRRRMLVAGALMAARRLAASEVQRPTPARHTPVIPLRPRVRSRAQLNGMAAAATVVLAVGAGVWRLESLRVQRRATAVHERDIATRPGERADVYLPDGSHVVLGAGSTLRYATDATRRDVALTGEAYFEVVHDPTHPFRVRAGGATAEDVGTAFDVRAITGERQVRVVVAGGAVSLRVAAHSTPAVLRRGTVAVVGAQGDVTVIHDVAVDQYLAWTRGELVFVDEPLPSAIQDIGRWYDLDIRLGDSRLAARTLTATFANDPVADVLRSVATAVDARVDRVGRVVTLVPLDQ